MSHRGSDARQLAGAIRAVGLVLLVVVSVPAAMGVASATVVGEQGSLSSTWGQGQSKPSTPSAMASPGAAIGGAHSGLVTRVIDGEPRPVVARSAEGAGTALGAGVLQVNVTAVELDNGTFYIGQILQTKAYSPGDDVVLRTGQGSFVTDVPGQNGLWRIDTQGLSPGTYRLTSPSGPTFEFDLVTQSYSVSASPRTVTRGGSQMVSELTISSNRAQYQYLITASELNAQELDRLFGGINGTPIDADADGDAESLLVTSQSTQERIDANFSGFEAGRYSIQFTVKDTTATDSVTITVESVPEPSAELAKQVVQGQVGTVVEIPITLEDTTTATVELGSQNLRYLVRLEVTDGNGDGAVTVRWDTASAGQGSANDAFRAVDGADSVTASRQTGAVTGSLAAEPYPMSLSVDGQETDVGSVALTMMTTTDVCGRDAAPLLAEYNDNVDAIPGFAAGLVNDKTVHGVVDGDADRDYSVVTGTDKRITDFQPGTPDDPSLVVETDCQTFRSIVDAQDSAATFTQAYHDGEVAVRGTGLLNRVIVGAIKIVVGIANALGFL